jgi:broad specificity phosphatase PhoE
VPTLLFLARHGQTEDNARQIFQGQGGSGLNARGRAQAARLAARVAGTVDAIVSSDLERARETADIVARMARLEVTFDRALREVDVGAWTGLSTEDVQARFPEEWAAWRSGVDVPRGGGETYADLAERVVASLAALAERARGKRVLVVSHGAALRSAVCKTLGLPARWTAPIAGMHNAALTTLVFDDGGGPNLLSYNDAAHLADLAD